MVHVFLLCSCPSSLLFPSVVVVSSVFFWLIYLWQFSLPQSFCCSCKFSTFQRNIPCFGDVVNFLVPCPYSPCSFYAVPFTSGYGSCCTTKVCYDLVYSGGTVAELASWLHISLGSRLLSFQRLISPFERVFSFPYCLTSLFCTEV